MQWLDGDDVGVVVVTGAVGLPLTTTRTRLGRIGFVESPVTRQSLDCMLR
jgi:FixJ family two-component response regulator